MFRPRYSLLTLLVLTALVAGGVKLWYGPHRVVEERYPGKEFEYTYTRDWNGKKYFQGPSIIRIYDLNGRVMYSTVTYFKNDQQIPFEYVFFKRKVDSVGRASLCARYLDDINDLPIITSIEKFVFRQAVEHERKIIDMDPGSNLAWCEWLGGFELRDGVFEHGNDLREWESYYEELSGRPFEDLIND